MVGVGGDEEWLASLGLLRLVRHWGRLVVAGNAAERQTERVTSEQYLDNTVKAATLTHR